MAKITRDGRKALTDKQVAYIREHARTRSGGGKVPQVDLAKKFGVTAAYVNDIVQGRAR